MIEEEFNLFFQVNNIEFSDDNRLFKELFHEEAMAAGLQDLRYREIGQEERIVAEAARLAEIKESKLRTAQLEAKIDMEVDATYEQITKDSAFVMADVFYSKNDMISHTEMEISSSEDSKDVTVKSTCVSQTQPQPDDLKEAAVMAIAETSLLIR